MARVTDQFNQQLDARFARLELAFERGTAATPPQQGSAPTQSDKRPAENDIEEEAPAPKRLTQTAVSAQVDPSLSSFTSFAQVTEACPPDSRKTLRPGSHQPARAAMTPPQATTSVVNNNNPTWKAWLAAADRPQEHVIPAPLYRAQAYDKTAPYEHDIDAQVRHILDVTPHQLKGNVPVGIYPFKYITRGPEKKKPSFNSLSLPEHILGMFRIIEDERLDPSFKPDILNHMKEVAEDACEFDWPGHVRRWSEEVFDLVAEGCSLGGGLLIPKSRTSGQACPVSIPPG